MSGFRVGALRGVRWLVLLPVALSWSCARPQADALDVRRSALGAASFTFTVSLPTGIDPAAVVLGASDHVAVADRSVIDPQPNAPRPLITNTGTVQSSVGVDTQIRTDILSRASVFLAERAAVAGGITTEGTVTRQNGTTVGGAIKEHQTIPVAAVSWTVAFPASSTGVSLEPGQTGSIAPGAYANVNVKSGAILTLSSPGTYFFDSLNVEPNGAKVVLTGNGPFTVYVRANLTIKGPLVRPAGAPPVATMLAFAGSNAVYLSAPFQGLLVAPGATLTLADIGAAVHDASFFARGIEFQASVHVRHRPAPLGPPETLTPPGPGGEFRCALVGQSKAVLSDGQSSSLLGTASLTLKPNGSFTVDLLDARGSAVCSGSSCSKVTLRPDPAATNIGSFSSSDGALQMNLAAVVRFADRSNRDSPINLAVQGRLQNRRLSAFATGTLPADAIMFGGTPLTVSITCDQQEPHQIVQATFNVDSAGTVSASTPTVQMGHRPAIQSSGVGYLLRTFDEQGNRIDEISFVDPRLRFDAAPLAAGSATLRIPFANGIRTLVLDGPTGPALIQLNLSSAATAFCATRPTNPECRRLVNPSAIQSTTLALSTGTDFVPGVNTARALGPEIQVASAPNQGSSPNDVAPSVAGIPSGTIAVTWFRNASSSKDIRIRFFGGTGAPLSTAQGLVAAGSTPTGRAHVSGSSAGQFVAVWEEIDLATLITNVIAQRFNAAGQPAGGRVTVVSGTSTTSPVGSNVALDGTGRFVVAWIEAQATGSSVLRARRFTSSDQTDGGVMNVSDTSPQTEPPAIAADDLGRFVIAYNEGGTPTNKIRRFDQNRNAAAPILLLSDPNPDLAIAMTPDTGEFTFLRSDGSQVLGNRYATNGQLITDAFGAGMQNVRVDGRNFGHQKRPRLAMLPGGEMLSTWASATTVSAAEIRVSAQSFTGDFVPIDIDFDAGLSRIPARNVGDQGADPVPHVAALADRFAVVWEAPGGIRMQIFKSGPYQCPANVNCGPGAPLMVNGDPENAYNLTIVRGDPCFPGGDPVLSQQNPNSFARLAVSHVVASFIEPNVEANRRRLNVFRGEEGDCSAVGKPNPTPYPNMDSIGFATDNLQSVTHSNLTFTFDFADASAYRHESAHSMFNVSDEYGCDFASGAQTFRIQPPVHGNLFKDLGSCMGLSLNPSLCHVLSGAPTACNPQNFWSTSDRDDDIMKGAAGNPTAPFGLDCQAQIQQIFEKIPCPARGSGSCR